MKFFLIGCVLISVFCDVFSEINYYWRDYAGYIPKDAVAGGTDVNGHNIYIGRAYLANKGFIPCQINPQVKEIFAPYGGAQQGSEYNEVL